MNSAAACCDCPITRLQEIADLLAACPEGLPRASAAAAIILQLASERPRAGLKWIEGWHPGATRDALIAAIPTLVDTDSDRMIKLVSQVSDGEQRKQGYESIVFYWLARDRKKALRGIPKSAVPDDVKVKALHPQ